MIGFEILQKSVDFIEAHLLDNITYVDVANQVNMSPYEFHRTFRFISGITPSAYIRNRRLSIAGQELLYTDIKVTDLAMKYWFDSVDGFTKAFSRFHGITPGAVKAGSKSLAMYNPLSIRVTMEGATPIKYKMAELGTVNFLVIPRSFSVDIIEDESDESISDFWGECINSKRLDLLKTFREKNDNRVFGLCSELKEDSTSFVYALAVAVPEDFDFTKAPEGFTKWQVEKSRYVIFDCYGKDGECISKAWENYFQNFLPQSGLQTKESPDFEIYFDDGDPDLMCELWIPVKKEDELKTDTNHFIDKVYAQFDYKNAASFGVMKKIGMTLVDDKGTRTYPKTGITSGEFTCLITREEWKKTRS